MRSRSSGSTPTRRRSSRTLLMTASSFRIAARYSENLSTADAGPLLSRGQRGGGQRGAGGGSGHRPGDPLAPREEVAEREYPADAKDELVEELGHVEALAGGLDGRPRAAAAHREVEAAKVVPEARAADDVDRRPRRHVLNVVLPELEQCVGEAVADLSKGRAEALDVVLAEGRVEEAPHLGVLLDVALGRQPLAEPVRHDVYVRRLWEHLGIAEDLSAVVRVARVAASPPKHADLQSL
mmetsp:Transcript_36049/g.85536  ORF Transcript_36049/g.85536 Transcript_36049/m.85536 type:complete len:239 (+) Transcript_36049:1047-1763(+)